MSDKDLEELCCVLNLMSQTAVARLNETDLWWLPDLGGVSKRQAINSIRYALQAFDSQDARVFCIAWLYCYLSLRRALPSRDTWRSYKADATGTTWTGRFVLHDLLANALRRQGCHAVSAKIEKLGRTFACVMAADPKRVPYQHDVIFLCVIPHRPQIFLRVDRNEASVVDVLRSVLRGGYTRILGDHVGQLRFAFDHEVDTRTRRNSAVSVEHELRHISKLPYCTDDRVKPRRSCAAKKSNGKVLATVNIPVMPKPKASSSSTQELTLVVAVNVVKKSHNESGTLKDGKK
ncbi:uncharacterized protein LOC119165750 [Rhipicephalus microplus]|uniref:uncharacterized protein LOC119165750 n=1 Tax=Rhipicephalus microplus TaxID=6941 RepID=UPI003F6B87FA